MENLKGIENLGDFGNGAVGGFFASLGVLAIFLVVVLSLAVIALWVIGSIGLMNLAKKNNIAHAWLVFLPVGRSYIIGKLGFESYGDKDNKNNNTFMWLTFGLGAASFLLGSSTGDLSTLIKYGLLFFECWAFYNIFKNINKKNSVIYTIFIALTGTLLGGLFVFLNKEEEPVKVEEVKEEPKEEKLCPSCGEPVTGKFCSNCGAKVEE